MRRNLLYGFSGLMLLGWSGTARADEMLLPAGTLLRCTLDEPNFSSKTAEDGEPLLCKTNSTLHFGRTVFPRGAYLGARLGEHKDPGRFWGKGYLRLEFDRIGLPQAELPLSGKVIAVRGYQVSRDGNIMGRGHAKRDVAQWLFPPLWPWKIVSLPARGPRPTLKGEVPVTLRLMEPIMLPQIGDASRRGFDRPSEPLARPSSLPATYLPPPPPAAERQFNGTSTANLNVVDSGSRLRQQPAKLTLFVFRDETIFGATDYWIDDGHLIYILSDGNRKTVDLGDIDWRRTNQLNSERGVRVALRTGQHTY